MAEESNEYIVSKSGKGHRLLDMTQYVPFRLIANATQIY